MASMRTMSSWWSRQAARHPLPWRRCARGSGVGVDDRHCQQPGDARLEGLSLPHLARHGKRGDCRFDALESRHGAEDHAECIVVAPHNSIRQGARRPDDRRWATNEKLLKRSERMLNRLTGCNVGDAREALKLAGGNLKIAALVLKGYERSEAERLLTESGQNLRKAFSNLPLRRNS